MKILVIGDTHGKLNKVRDIFPRLTNIDLIVHTGDFIGDGQKLEKEFGIPVVAVKGNCDGSYSSDDFETFDTEYGKMMVTHGHMENVNSNFTTLYYKALENKCVAVLFGHTHKALIHEEDDIYLVNPGSLTLPRDGTDGSYAVLRTSEDDFDASVVYYSTVMKTSAKKTQAGFIRNLLNNSDRF
ncbi:MAG: metallophosphoesterase [Clostridiales bacterium]|nr:metallophosphoesterase [Clostridiales bacterium]